MINLNIIYPTASDYLTAAKSIVFSYKHLADINDPKCLKFLEPLKGKFHRYRQKNSNDPRVRLNQEKYTPKAIKIRSVLPQTNEIT
ncbi:unnamed protein product, partial [Brachionus calyciflorus]